MVKTTYALRGDQRIGHFAFPKMEALKDIQGVELLEPLPQWIVDEARSRWSDLP